MWVVTIVGWQRKVREGELGDWANMSEIGWTFLRVTIYGRDYSGKGRYEKESLEIGQI